MTSKTLSPLVRSIYGHGRLVRFLRVFLPFCGVVLLGVGVFWPQFMKTLTPPVLEKVIRKVNFVAKLRFHSTDDHGKPVMIEAQTAEHQGSDQAKLDHPSSQFSLEDGTKMEVSASLGDLKKNQDSLGLSGNVDLKTESGYRLEAPHAQVDLKNRVAESNDPVRGQSPRGKIHAQEGVRISADGVVLFKGKTKLIIPQKEREKTQDDPT